MAVTWFSGGNGGGGGQSLLTEYKVEVFKLTDNEAGSLKYYRALGGIW